MVRHACPPGLRASRSVYKRVPCCCCCLAANVCPHTPHASVRPYIQMHTNRHTALPSPWFTCPLPLPLPASPPPRSCSASSTWSRRASLGTRPRLQGRRRPRASCPPRRPPGCCCSSCTTQVGGCRGGRVGKGGRGGSSRRDPSLPHLVHVLSKAGLHGPHQAEMASLSTADGRCPACLIVDIAPAELDLACPPLQLCAPCSHVH